MKLTKPIATKVYSAFAVLGALFSVIIASPSYGSTHSSVGIQPCLTSALEIKQSAVQPGYGMRQKNFIPLEISQPGFNCRKDTRQVQFRAAESRSRLTKVLWTDPVRVNTLVNKFGKLNLRFSGEEGCMNLDSQLLIEVRVGTGTFVDFTKTIELPKGSHLCAPVSLVIDDSQIQHKK